MQNEITWTIFQNYIWMNTQSKNIFKSLQKIKNYYKKNTVIFNQIKILWVLKFIKSIEIERMNTWE